VFDGTLWQDENDPPLSRSKTGRRMGHMSVSVRWHDAAFRDIPVKRKILVHINNSNPIWSTIIERAGVVKEGWECYDGMR